MSATIEKTAQDGPTAIYKITSGGVTAQGIVSRLPCSEQSMLAISCARGILLCRLYDVAVASRLGVPAAVFSAADLRSMLDKTPLSLSDSAIAAGAAPDMTGEQLMALFSR